MKFPTLYGKNSSGKLKIWEVFTEDNRITVRHGMLGSDKIQSQYTLCEAKNVGKANETSPSQQAEIEAQAKWVKQKKKGYFETKEEALSFIERTPMKAQNYNDYAHKIAEKFYLQPKLNGRRLLIDSEGSGQSKQGEVNHIPEHWKEDLEKLRQAGYLEHGLDGEVFAGYQKQGGLSLQQIGSAYLKPNENTHKLKYYVYDIPAENMAQKGRVMKLLEMAEAIPSLGITNVVIVETDKLNSHKDADALYKAYLEQGAEGVVYRNPDASYEFGKRSYNLIKRKPRQDTESLVIGCTPDKNNDGVLTCQLENGIEFKCLMRKDSHETINYRRYENAKTLIASFITVEYEELSDSGVPQKPCGIVTRCVNSNWEAMD